MAAKMGDEKKGRSNSLDRSPRGPQLAGSSLDGPAADPERDARKSKGSSFRSFFYSAAPPKVPKGDGHHYHKHHLHSPAEQLKSVCAQPDLCFAILFIGAVCMQFSFAMTYGEEATEEDDIVNEKTEGRKVFQGMIAATCGIAVVSSFIFIMLLKYCGRKIIPCLIYSCLLVMYTMCVILYTYELHTAASIMLAVSTALLLYFCCHKGHLEFAGACLEISSEIIMKYPMMEFFALAAVVVQMGWASTFGYALLGLQIEMKDRLEVTTENATYYVMATIAIAFTYFWGQQTIRNAVVCTTAGTTSSWWFHKKSERHPTIDAAIRSCTTSLGAIAFGSFFAALVQTICYFMHKLDKQLKKWQTATCVRPLLWCLTCILKCLQKCIEMFNFYAFVIVGIYGYSYTHAASHVVKIFFSKGMLLAEEGTLVSMVLLLGQLAVGLTSGAVGVAIVYEHPDLLLGVPYAQAMVFSCCALVGWGVSQSMFGVVEAANAAVFICYVENPHALHDDHEKAYHKLHKAWLRMGKTEVKHDYIEKRSSLDYAQQNA